MRTLARWAVQFEDWETAEGIYQEMLEIAAEKKLPPWKSLCWTLMAGLYLETGDRGDDYKELCKAAMNAFGDSDMALMIQQTARICCAVPPGHFIEESVAMAERVPGVPEILMVKLALGMAQYRAGRYEKAADALEISEKIARASYERSKDSRHSLPLTLAYRSMVSFQLGEKVEAEKQLAEAREFLEPLFDQFLWHERVFTRLAIEEAERLLQSEPGAVQNDLN